MTSPNTLRSPDKPSVGVAPLPDTVETAVVDVASALLVLDVYGVMPGPDAEVVSVV